MMQLEVVAYRTFRDNRIQTTVHLGDVGTEEAKKYVGRLECE